MLSLDDRIDPRADVVDRTLNQIVRLEREVVFRHDAGAGEENRAFGEGVAAAEVADQIVARAGQFSDVRLPGEGGGTAPADEEADADVIRIRHADQQGNAGPQGAATV